MLLSCMGHQSHPLYHVLLHHRLSIDDRSFFGDKVGKHSQSSVSNYLEVHDPFLAVDSSGCFGGLGSIDSDKGVLRDDCFRGSYPE